MSRILLNNGLLEYMYGVCAVKEEIVELEGNVKRVYECVKDVSSANGVKIEFEDGGCYIGNISGGKVRDILSGIAEKGYLNCLDLGVKDVAKTAGIEDGTPYIQAVDYMEFESVDVAGKEWGASQTGAGLFQPSPFGGDPFGAPQAPIFNGGFHGAFNGGNAQCRCGCGCGCSGPIF